MPQDDSVLLETKSYNFVKSTQQETFRNIKVYKNSSNIDDYEEFFSLGSILFKIIETLEDVQSKIKEHGKNVNILTKYDIVQDICDKHFYNQKFFDTFLRNSYLIELMASPFSDHLQYLKHLQIIKYFLDICSINGKYCSTEYLIVLASHIPFEVNPLNQFISTKTPIKIKKINDEITIKELFKIYDNNRSDSFIQYSYNFESLLDICLSSLQCIFDNGYIIKRCANCGNYFIPFNRSDTIYCDRASLQDNSKTCKEYGAHQAYKEKLQNDRASGLYRAIYMQKQMLLRRNPDIQKYKDDFDNFKSRSAQWKKEIKNGLKKEQEFIDWLENIKSNR